MPVCNTPERGRARAAWPDGIAYRREDGTITVLPKTVYRLDVDRLPWPAYDLLNFDDYRHDTRTWHNPYQVDLSLRVPIITSRGCPESVQLSVPWPSAWDRSIGR